MAREVVWANFDTLEPADPQRPSTAYRDRKVARHTTKGGQGKVARLKRRK